MKKENKDNKKGNISPTISQKNSNRQTLSLREAMSKLFDESVWDPFDVFDNSILKQTTDWPDVESFSPRINLSENNKNIVVDVDLPGVNQDDIDVEVSDNSLIISGKTEKEEEEENKKFYRYERESGSFYREILLPAKVDEKKAVAKMKDGVLEIILPKVNKNGNFRIKVK